jgi:hypothetical protein
MSDLRFILSLESGAILTPPSARTSVARAGGSGQEDLLTAIGVALGRLRVPLICLTAGVAAALSFGSDAGASGDCDRLRRAISDASHGPNAQYEAAAARQRSEIERTVAYAHQIGCDNQKFLFFGSDPPPQCNDMKAQIGRMRANLDDLQSRAGGGAGGRGELLARYNAECAGQPDRPPGLIESLFGNPKPGDVQQEPLSPDPDDNPQQSDRIVQSTGEARAGGEAVCVRSCDGAFFPVTYSAGGSQLDSLADRCRALCPATEVTLYTMPVNGQIEQAVSINGAKYMDSPTALRYRKTFDASCSCRRRGQTWSSVLGPAEQLLGDQNKSDIIVDGKKAEELSKPVADAGKGKTPKTPKASATPAALTNDGGHTDANGVDMALRDATATISREGSGIGGAADSKAGPVGENQGKTFDETGADGVKKKVRVISN